MRDLLKAAMSIHMSYEETVSCLLDIRNAFSSVPHAAILATLRYLGVPDKLTSLISNAYRGASTTIKTPDGSTRAIPCQARLPPQPNFV